MGHPDPPSPPPTSQGASPDPSGSSPETGPVRARRFFLDPASLDPGEPSPRLAEEDLHHALHVNRLQVGDPLWGLDGQGGARLLRVVRASRKAVELEDAGQRLEQPPPGTPGSGLAWVEIALSMPKPNRVEDMLARLTQLGVARVQPILCRHSSPTARSEVSKRAAKWDRAVRESMKQCARLWPLEIAPLVPLEEWWERSAADARLLLHADADPLLTEALPPNATAKTWHLGIGPEGGFHDAELQAKPCARLKGHILRTETAAELAAGVALQVLGAP